MPERPSPYHHGDLRAALVAAALTLTRESGPGALSLRAATRLAGVSPAAAYRHFRDRSALLRAAAHEIQDRMADNMRQRMDTPADAPAADRALRHLRGVGLGYVAFARAEKGWFETAFFGDPPADSDQLPAERIAPPFDLLTIALDELVAAGCLLPEHRAGAEYTCWSAVHGCAELMIHGPLRSADEAAQQRVTERVVDDVIAGIRR